MAGSSAGQGASLAKFSKRAIGIGRAEEAGFGVAGKVADEFCQPGAGAALDRSSERKLRGAERGHAGAEARGVERVDGKDAKTALRAADAAGQRVSGAAGGIGERGVDDLHEFGVARGKGHEGQHTACGGNHAAIVANMK